ncbi:MAG: FkbM family methyltransferase [Planctomycetota bacterium]
MRTLVMKAMGAYAKVAPTQRGGFRLCRLARKAWPREQWQGRRTNPHGLSLDTDLGTYPDVAMAFGLYELDTLRVLRKHLQPGSVFVDGGANLGYFTLHAARLGATVHAFEPDPANRARLEANLAANDLTATVHPAALTDTPGSLTLHHPPEGDHFNHGQTSLLESLAAGGTTSTVDAVRLDAQLDHADVIKLDVEGAELGALRGMAGLLSGERPPTLVVEVNGPACRAAGHAPGELLRAVQDVNGSYRCWWIGGRLRELPGPDALDDLPLEGNVLMRPAAKL